LLDAHPPFQIDGNFGGAAAVAEMLVQSNADYIELLPALPKAWSTGAIKGIKARGNYEIDMSWSAGQVTNVKIKSNTQATAKVLMNGKIQIIKTSK
jgi:alpha-L-fucosidase 2